MEIEIPNLQDLEFVERCWHCAGSGNLWTEPKRAYKDRPAVASSAYPCPTCDGKGRTLTQVGDKLIEFLKSLGVAIPKEDGWRQL